MAIDSSSTVLGRVQEIADAGHEAVIRYLSPNSHNHPTKRLTSAEVAELGAAGMWIGGVWEANGDLSEMNAPTGTAHATEAVQVWSDLGAPAGSTIFFAVDFSPSESQITSHCVPYFTAVNDVVSAAGFQTGCYGPGGVCQATADANIASQYWVANAPAWIGTKEFVASGGWDILQKGAAGLPGLGADLDTFNLDPGAVGLWQVPGAAPLDDSTSDPAADPGS